jgi:putative phosphoesterase
MKTAGIISDTHGLLRPEALAALQGVDLIVHAGDIGHTDIIPQLSAIAPTHAICGNIDRPPITKEFPQYDIVEIEGLLLYVLHDRGQIDLDPRAAGVQIVVFGHSHRQYLSLEQGVLYLNPASAGPRRFNLPISLALLRVCPEKETAPPPWPQPAQRFSLVGEQSWTVDVRFDSLE